MPASSWNKIGDIVPDEEIARKEIIDMVNFCLDQMPVGEDLSCFGKYEQYACGMLAGCAAHIEALRNELRMMSRDVEIQL